ncbi:MAG: TlpA family protein disulfide reductase [Deferrisomatales bacterium]
MARAARTAPLALVGALALWASLLPVVSAAEAGPAPGEPAPGFALGDLEGRVWTLERLRRGGPVLLDFGSVFCAACQEALRGLEQTRQTFVPRGLAVAAVNVDGPKAARAVATVTRSLGVGYPVLLDGDGAVAEAYGVEVIPFLVLVDAAGTVRAVHRGLAADLAAVLDLEAALAAAR